MTKTYPNYPTGHHELAYELAALGQFERAIPEYQEAIRRHPNSNSYGNLVGAFLAAEHLDEAKSTVDQALAQKFDVVRFLYYDLAFLADDQATMRQIVDWAADKPEYERRLLEMESQTEAFHGRRRHAREFANRAIQSAEQDHLPAGAATDLLNLALNEVEFGDSPKAREDAAAALALAADTNNKAFAAVVFARARDSARAEKLSAELEQTETAVKPSAQQLCAALRSSCDSVAAW